MSFRKKTDLEWERYATRKNFTLGGYEKKPPNGKEVRHWQNYKYILRVLTDNDAYRYAGRNYTVVNEAIPFRGYLQIIVEAGEYQVTYSQKQVTENGQIYTRTFPDRKRKWVRSKKIPITTILSMLGEDIWEGVKGAPKWPFRKEVKK